MKPILQALLLTVLSALDSFAQTLDVSQPDYSTTNDLSRSGESGQTFTCTKSATLKGVRLYVEGEGRNSTSPYGSEFIVSLHKVVDGKIQNPPITSGSVTKEAIQFRVPVQIDVYFDQPHIQYSGDVLAFTILGTSGGGDNGWNEYGMIRGDVYTQGSQFYGYSDDGSITPSDNDFAFSTIIENRLILAPEELSIEHTGNNQLSISLPNSAPGRIYVLQGSTDLSTWTDQSSKTGTGEALTWSRTADNPKEFFRVRNE